MKLVIDRDPVKGKWLVSRPDKRDTMTAFDADDARDAVKHIQALFPDAEVGVASTVFGKATVSAFGPVVWMKPNLN